MANRIIRDWTASESMDSLSPEAEVLFTRLIMKADDYGSYYANPKLIRSALFPLKNYTIDNILSWIDECIAAGLIAKYSVENKEYIRIFDFGQRLRNMRNIFPQPVSELSASCQPETKRNEVEYEEETETESEHESEPKVLDSSFEEFWELYDKKVTKPKAEKLWKKIPRGAREKIMMHAEQYVLATPDKTYRKDPTTYLRNECWNDEITIHGKQQATNRKTEHTIGLATSVQEAYRGIFERGGRGVDQGNTSG